MAVRYLNATGTQYNINETKRRLAQKADLTTVQALQQTVQQVSESVPTKTSDLENDSNFITAEEISDDYASKSALDNLSQVVQGQTTDIATLNADDTTAGSVDYKIKQALSNATSFKLVATLPDADKANVNTIYFLAESAGVYSIHIISGGNWLTINDLSAVKASIESLSTSTTANATDISALQTALANLTSDVNDNSTAISANSSAITAAQADITTNTSAISANSSSIDTINGTDTGSSMRDVAEDVVSTIPKSITPKGTIEFADLPALADAEVGDMYNIEDAFTTTADFIMGAGTSMSANSNVYVIDAGSGTKKWDVFATQGIADMSAYQTKTLTSHTGITATTVETALEEVAGGVADNASSISALETTVGDNTSGLVKDVADNASDISDLQTAVGDASSGLVKDVADNASDISDLQTAVGDASSGLVKDVADNASDISDLQALVPSTASATNKLVTEQGFTKTQLTNEDLDTILTQGYYYTNGADSVTNKPADNLANWELEVSAFGGRVIQIFTCGNSIYNAPTSGIVFYRVYGISGLAWSEWRQLATDSDLASLQSDISDNATAISALDTTVAGLRTIRNLDTSHSAEQGKDLNDFKGDSSTITTYWFRYASGFSNIPTPTFGSFDWLLLTVENASNRVQQTALLQKANNQAERWTRAFVYADVSGKTEWSSWTKLVTDDDSLPVEVVNLHGTAAEPTDLNNVASNYKNRLVSVYYGEAGSVLNTPVLSHCMVFQFSHVSNPNYLTQICFPISRNQMYIRYCANGTWHDWVDIATDKLFIENWVNPDTDYFTAVNGIAVASVNPGRLPSIGVPGNDYSTYATFIALGGSNYKTALYIDVFGNLATWGSNQKQWYKVQMKGELTVTYGTWTIDGTYCTDGSISWYKYGRVVVVTLSNVKFSSWTGADHIITTNAGPKSMVAVGASILPINSAEAPQLIAIRTDGKITTQGSMSHSGTFFGSFTYITAE